MESIWFKPDLADEIIKSESIFEQTNSIVTDIISKRIDITDIVENMAGVLTNKEPEVRQKGMIFFTKLLKEIPKNYLTSLQLKFISKFYIDRLKDNHRVIPSVLEGYLAIIEMINFDVQSCGEYFTTLFREVSCQSQVRQDRLHIYLTLQKLMERDAGYMKAMGPDFLYGVISAIDGERDPRNLLFLFGFLPKFLSHVPLGHLVDEMFEVISCYYPIDFYPKPNDPAPVTRDDLAAALCPCLCAVPEFGEQCLILLVEKLDSSLRVAKLDSLKLLTESCKTFNADSYGPFLKTLWSSIYREITHKTDDELRMAGHEALSALVAKLASTANTDQAFENFVKGVIISLQTSLVDSKTVHQFVQATKVLLTVANSSKISCAMITRSMIPSVIAYYEFKNTSKLQTASLDFLGDLYEIAVHWDILNEVGGLIQEVPNLCLTAASEPSKEYQVAGLKTLIRFKDVLNVDLVVPFVEIVIYNIQHSNDDDVLKYSVNTIHAIAKKYPETIMNLVVKGKCDLDNLTEDKATLQNRLNLLSSLASFDDFTEMIIVEILKLIASTDEAPTAVKALNVSLSDSSLYTAEKVVQIESDHGLIGSVLTWLLKDVNSPEDSLSHGYELISNTISRLPSEKQLQILQRHTNMLLENLKNDENYYPILHCLYSSIHQDLWTEHFDCIMKLSLELSLNSNSNLVRTKACHLVAHFLNKSEFGLKFEFLYEMLKNYLSGCSKEDDGLCPRLIFLYGFITKALVMRGSELFKFWLQKITIGIMNPNCSNYGAEAMRVIMTESPAYLSSRQYCRSSLMYRQRVFHAFTGLMHACTCDETKEAYYLSWAYVIGGTPKSVISSEINKLAPLIIEALDFDNKDLLLVMMDVLIYFIQAKHATVAQSLQTILPRLLKLSTYVKSMDVRIKSLQCLYEVANSYPTVLLLPYKRDVLLELASSLDDKKRLVRNVAVRARTRWFLVGSPGEPKDD